MLTRTGSGGLRRVHTQTIQNGMVDGDRIRFETTRGDRRISWEATLTDGRLKFTRRVEKRSVEFTALRES